MTAYDLPQFVAELRAITASETDEKQIVQRVAPLAKRLADDPHWVKPEYYDCCPDQGFGVHLLHEDDDHRNAVFVISWLPKHGIKPHNHNTWAVVAGIDGTESEIVWRRKDDRSRPGFADLEPCGKGTVGAGGLACLLSDDIHSVRNEGETTSISLHVYGRHLNYTGRSQFDPDARREDKLVVKVEDCDD
ncbi:MAG: hypothetical protein AB7G39_19385 [Alphaproteobacteria bacterium]